MTDTKNLAIAELVIYLVLLPAILFILYRHGLPGLLGWIFIVTFSALRIVSDGLAIGNSTGSAGSIINAIGLSPLMLAVSGIIHESHRQIPNVHRKLGWVVQIVLHFLIVIALALSASGGSKLSSNSSGHDRTKAYHRLETGAVLYLLLTIALACYILWVVWRLRQPRATDPVSALSMPSPTVMRLAERLAYAVVAAMPFVIVRAVYSVAYAFDHNPKVSPSYGDFGIKFVLVFLVPLIAVLALVTGGILTRNMRWEEKKLKEERLGGTYSPPMTTVWSDGQGNVQMA